MKLTVALVTYNRPEYLKYAIKGILDQTFSDFEFLILDNGSDSKTAEVIKLFSDSRIKYIRKEKNDVEFINYPFEIAQGDYIIITHDDDVMKDTFLEREVSILDSLSEVSVVSTGICHINDKGEIINEKVVKLKHDKLFYKYDYIKSYFFNGNYLACPTMMMRLSTVREHNLKYNFDVGPMADLYLNFQFNLQDKALYFISEPLYKYRIHDKQDSGINGISMEFQIIPFLKKLFLDSKQSLLANKYEQAALSQLIYSLTVKFVLGKLSFKSYVENIKEVLNRNLKLSKYLFFWSIKGLLKSVGKRIKDFLMKKR
jgi:glycosyltransferase involved in cell wall biosynthesis